MDVKISKEQQHQLNQLRFKKSPQEKEQSKLLKSAWKKEQLRLKSKLGT